jgi:signal transduction histidine kinase
LVEDEVERLSAVGRHFVQRLLVTAQRLDTMVADLLEYSQLARSRLKLEPVGLEALLEEVLQEMRPEIERAGATVQVRSPMPQVLAHGPTLKRIVANVVTNALKFVKPGERPAVMIEAAEEGRQPVLCVQDSGIGIAAEHHDRIFNAFERLHGQERYPGTGIGLAIVRKGMERMGGRVELESAAGGGARFKLVFQAA